MANIHLQDLDPEEPSEPPLPLWLHNRPDHRFERMDVAALQDLLGKMDLRSPETYDQQRNVSHKAPVAPGVFLPRAEIYLLGFGMRLPNDLTLETFALLHRCNQLFGMPPFNGQALGLPEIENLTAEEHYNPNKRRIEAYRRGKDRVLEAARENPPVGLVTYGHPSMGNWTVLRILQEADREGFHTHVTGPASFLEGVCADLKVDPFDGMQLYQAQSFHRNRYTPSTEVEMLLCQVNAFQIETGYQPETSPPQPDLDPLREYLLEFYPSDHEVTSTTTDSYFGSREMVSFPLQQLQDRNEGGLEVNTLFLPRLSNPRGNRRETSAES